MRFALFMMLALTSLGFARDKVLIPQIGSEWWTIAVSPDLGEFTSEKQQPVDFAAHDLLAGCG